MMARYQNLERNALCRKGFWDKQVKERPVYVCVCVCVCVSTLQLKYLKYPYKNTKKQINQEGSII